MNTLPCNILFLPQPTEKLGRLTLQHELREIGAR